MGRGLPGDGAGVASTWTRLAPILTTATVSVSSGTEFDQKSELRSQDLQLLRNQDNNTWTRSRLKCSQSRAIVDLWLQKIIQSCRRALAEGTDHFTVPVPCVIKIRSAVSFSVVPLILKRNMYNPNAMICLLSFVESNYKLDWMG